MRWEATAQGTIAIAFAADSQYLRSHSAHWLGSGDGVAWGEPDYAAADAEGLSGCSDGWGQEAEANIRCEALRADRLSADRWRARVTVSAETTDTFDRLWPTWDGSRCDLIEVVHSLAG